MNVGIIGCGFIGNKRAKSLPSDCKLVAVADTELSRAQSLASHAKNIQIFDDWKKLLEIRSIDIVVIATSNDFLTTIAKAALDQGKHVLVEKPAARNFSEILSLYELSKGKDTLVKVGFNHRFHPALLKSKELWDKGELGEMMFIRGRYGHGGRLGYEKEWRAKPQISGGGELHDQGVHLIDLSRIFLGDFDKIEGHAATYYWKMPVDDNAFLSLRTQANQTAWLQVSCSEWKNTFSFEIYGTKAKVQIDGLGGSYGVEKCTFYKMLKEMGPPETTTWEYPFPDMSWNKEFINFVHAIEGKEELYGNLRDAVEALRVVERIYQASGYAYH